MSTVTNTFGTITNEGVAEITETKANDILGFLNQVGFSEITVLTDFNDVETDGMTLSTMGIFTKKDVSNITIPSWIDENYVLDILEDAEQLSETTLDFTDFDSLDETQANFVKAIDNIVWDLLIQKN